MCLLGSRTQMCVHKDISRLSGAAQDFACRTAVASRSCAHHRAVEAHARSSDDSEPRDIEDMVADGRAGGCGPCPYFLSRERAKVRTRRHCHGLRNSPSAGFASRRVSTAVLTALDAQTAEITFLPYNYLLDPKLRKNVCDVDWCAGCTAALR